MHRHYKAFYVKDHPSTTAGEGTNQAINNNFLILFLASGLALTEYSLIIGVYRINMYKIGKYM